MQQGQVIIPGVVWEDIIKHNVTAETISWLNEKASLIRKEDSSAQLNLAFAAVSSKAGRKIIELTEAEKSGLNQVHPQFIIKYWSIDKLCRVWILLQVDSSDKENYCRKLENLFKAAEMNELAALYAALPFFEYPDYWQKQCAEGIRSNIGIVLEAIMYNNPYPYKYLNEPAWNQLVLKAFFTEKDVKRIIGLDERTNKELATILIDYANERWAAHRVVNPQLWRLISQFIDHTNFSNAEKAFNSNDPLEKKAVALACFHSNYQPAKQLIEREPELTLAIKENKLNWNAL